MQVLFQIVCIIRSIVLIAKESRTFSGKDDDAIVPCFSELTLHKSSGRYENLCPF